MADDWNSRGVLLILVAYTVLDEEDEFIRIISARKVTRQRSKSNMKKQTKSKSVIYELKPDQPLTARQKREIKKLVALPEDKIDTSGIPELPPGAWKNAIRGKWYRPVKQPVSLRLDADVLAWLKSKGNGYQTKVNLFLRERMLKEIGK